jgi:hypothetical protein
MLIGSGMTSLSGRTFAKWRYYLVHLLNSQGTLYANGPFLKTSLTYCLVILLMSLSVGGWIISVPVANFLKSRADIAMQQSANQLCLRLHSDAFKRVGADELIVGGRLYDVVSEQKQGDWIEFVLYRDDLESYFLQFLVPNPGTADFSEDQSSPLGAIMKTILRLEFYSIPFSFFESWVPFFYALPQIHLLALLPANPILKVPLPPPQFQ